ncbi:MAG: hypothetical protein KDC38_18900 [Planctomycetes bacterium]|nr:hypothetical protein [Planctomycetota bacterium]
MRARGLAIAVLSASITFTNGLDAQYLPNPSRVLHVTEITATVGGSATVQVLFDHPTMGGCQDLTSGWSINLEHDPALIEVSSVDLGSDALPLSVGSLAFSSIEIHPEGVSLHLLSSIAGGGPTLPFGTDLELYTVTYDTIAAGTSVVQPCSCTDWSLLITYFEVNCFDEEYIPAFEPGSVTVVDAVAFVRGDSNQDDLTDIADMVFLLAALFQAGSPDPVCEDAADMNDDGVLNIADAIAGLSALFSGGSIPAPVGTCGVDPTVDTLSCGTSTCP